MPRGPPQPFLEAKDQLVNESGQASGQFSDTTCIDLDANMVRYIGNDDKNI